MAIHRLYSELAASLVRAITDCWAPGTAPARAGAKLDDMCQTAFECARNILARLGLATDEHKLAIDADRVAQFVMDRSRASQITLPPIDDVLTAWILLCGSQLGLASLRRLPFTPHDDIRPVMDALAALGYAKPLGNTFIWMDKIGPAMQMSGYWDKNNLSREELE